MHFGMVSPLVLFDGRTHMYNPRRVFRIALATAFGIGAVMAITPPARAAQTFTVTAFDDRPDVTPGDGQCEASGGGCTLRAAIDEANALAGPDTVVLPAGTVTIANQLTLAIKSDIELRGSGKTATVIDLAGSRGLNIASPSGAISVKVSALTIRGGRAQTGGGLFVYSSLGTASVTVDDVDLRDNYATMNGAGLYVGPSHSVTMHRVTIDSNITEGVGAGGVSNAGILRIEDSTISRNQSWRVGGISSGPTSNAPQAVLALINVTVSDNYLGVQASAGTGGIVNRGYASLTSVTITGNEGMGTSLGSLIGGGILTTSTAVTEAKNTIIAGNRNAAFRGGAPVGPQDCVGPLSPTTRYVLIQDITNCGLSGSQVGFITGVSANLGALQSNGGPTETRLPMSGSPVIDAGYGFAPPDVDACPITDQRGVRRLYCDLGATEVEVQVPTTIAVTTTFDAPDTKPSDAVCLTALGGCSLRAAVMEANRLPGAQTITLPAGTFALAIPPNEFGIEPAIGGDLDISDTTTIVGDSASATIVDAGGNGRVFENSFYNTLSLSRMTVQGGRESGYGGGIESHTGSNMTLTDLTVRDNIGFEGGGIHMSDYDSVLTISNSNITGNSTSYGQGGGISSDGSVTLTDSRVEYNTSSGGAGGVRAADATILRSTIAGNRTQFGYAIGGGLYVGHLLTMDDSTVSGNTGTAHGGGIFLAGGLIRNSTISGNASDTGGGISTNGLVTLRHVTVAFNTATSGQGTGLTSFGSGAGFRVWNSIVWDPTGLECSGPAFQARKGNVLGDTSCGRGDVIADPLLMPLASNGGSTLTHALDQASPAIDAGYVKYSLPYDQRLVARIARRSDAGAFEASEDGIKGGGGSVESDSGADVQADV
jgi:CSLREA domain-containing protein